MSSDVLLPLLTLMFGGTFGGGIVTIVKAVRGRKVEDVDLVERIRRMATEEVTRADARLESMQARLDDLDQRLNDERRRAQALEAALQRAGIAIPPWPPETATDEPLRVERRGVQRPIDFEDRRKG